MQPFVWFSVVYSNAFQNLNVVLRMAVVLFHLQLVDSNMVIFVDQIYAHTLVQLHLKNF